MGAPRSRFAAQFVTLLQLQTCCLCLAVPADSGNTKNQENRKSKKSEKSSGKKATNQDHKQGGFLKNSREIEQESNCKQNVETSKDFEIKSIQQNGQHDMKRRNVLDGKPRRPVKRPTTSSKIGENFYGR